MGYDWEIKVEGPGIRDYVGVQTLGIRVWNLINFGGSLLGANHLKIETPLNPEPSAQNCWLSGG